MPQRPWRPWLWAPLVLVVDFVTKRLVLANVEALAKARVHPLTLPPAARVAREHRATRATR